MIRPDSLLESQDPNCDPYALFISGMGLARNILCAGPPRLSISITDRSVTARSSKRAEPKCAKSSSATSLSQILPQVSLATSTVGPFGIPDISRRLGDRHFRMAKTHMIFHTGKY